MQYDKNRFKVLALPHPFILFWVLCPVVIFNELIVGQRLPKLTLIDKKNDKSRTKRTYVPCPHCETLNDSRLWANGIVFGRWFGLVCPSCHEIIPCLWNIFSLAILAITSPLWYFPARFFRQRWFEKEKERLAKGLEHPLIQAKPQMNLLYSCFFCGLMGVMWVTIFEVLNGWEWNWMIIILTSLLFGMVSSSVWGFCEYFFMNRKGEKADKQVSD